MKELLIIQLNDEIDLIRTVESIQNIVVHQSNYNLSLVASRANAVPLEFILGKIFNTIYYFEDFAKEELSGVANKVYDLVINLSYCKDSFFVEKKLNYKIWLGPKVNESNQIEINDLYSQYIYSNYLRIHKSSFHIIDLFKSIIGTDKLNPHQVFRSSFVKESKDNKKIIVLSPFSHEKRTQWSLNNWQNLTTLLLKKNPDCEIIYIDNESNEVNFQTILEKIDVSHHARISYQNTSHDYSKFVDVMENSTLLISSDNTHAHLAALYRMKSLILSLGSNDNQHSYPYNENALLLTPKSKCYPCTQETPCEFFICHLDIKPEIASNIAGKMLETQETFNPRDLGNTETAGNSFSLLKVVNLDSATLKTEDLNPSTTQSFNDITKLVNSIIFSYYLKNIEVKLDFPRISDECLSQLKSEVIYLQKIYEVYNHGKVFAKNLSGAIATGKNEEVQQSIKQINEVTNLALHISKKSKLLSSLISFFHTRLLNSTGNDLLEISQSYLVGFHDAANLISVIDELTHLILAPHLSRKNPDIRNGTSRTM